MYFTAKLSKRAAILISLQIFSSVSAISSNAKRQTGSDDSCDGETPTLDGPTSDKSAGLGMEFECSAIVLRSPECSAQDTNQAKGKVVTGRKGTNWELTADTTSNVAGSLAPEYILDGTNIKIGDGTASVAAKAAFTDLLDWKQYKDMPENNWNIDGNNCNPWQVTNPSVFNSDSLRWLVQATAPLPFEAISDLFAESISGHVTSPLLSAFKPEKNKVSVTSQFFQSNPNGISSDSVKKDVLGFFSLVISYIKQASPINPPRYLDSSSKNAISIMPRTEFATLYAQVKGVLPSSASLYNLVKVLACNKNQGHNVEIDSQFCDDTTSTPKPNQYIDSIGWCLEDSSNGDKKCLAVSDWIASIETGPSPDKLTELDRLIDGQIGGLSTALENVIGTTRGVPLFEYRDLNGVIASKFETITTDVEGAIQKFHENYQSPPSNRRKARRFMKNGKRQDSTPCPAISSAPAMPTCVLQNEDPDQGINARGCVCGSTTLPLLTLTSVTNQDQSCSYTAFPTTSVPNPISIMSTTYTTKCRACTIVGGIADYPTCTSVAGCTPTSTVPPVAATTPPPVCKPGFYGTDPSCGGNCNGPSAECDCTEAGYLVFNLACDCTC